MAKPTCENSALVNSEGREGSLEIHIFIKFPSLVNSSVRSGLGNAVVNVLHAITLNSQSPKRYIF